MYNCLNHGVKCANQKWKCANHLPLTKKWWNEIKLIDYFIIFWVNCKICLSGLSILAKTMLSQSICINHIWEVSPKYL